MPPLNKPFRKFHHNPLQPPIAAHLDPEDGDHLVFDDDLNKFDSVQPESELLDYIDFNTLYTDGTHVARLQWNADAGTLELGLSGGTVVLQIGQEVTQPALNDEGAPIPNGTPVYITGGTIDHPEVKIADKGTFAAAAVFGITTELIGTGAVGYVTSFGLVRGVDTSLFLAGKTLWLDSAGALVSVRPTPGAATALMVGVGICLHSDASDGVIFVNPYIVPRLLGLSDVQFGVPSDGELLAYSAGDSRFELQSPVVPAPGGALETGTALAWDDTAGEFVPASTIDLWEDLRVPVTSVKTGGSKDPDFSVVIDDGVTSQGVFAYHFDDIIEEEVFFAVQLPHTWDVGTGLHVHVHWLPSTGAAGDVVWGLEYTWVNIGDVMGNTALITGKESAAGVALTHQMTQIGATELSGTGKTESSMMLCRLYRDATDVVNDTYGDDAILMEIDFHYRVAKIGEYVIW